MQISSSSHYCSFKSPQGATARGFSLVELLVVVSVTALIATIVIVRFSSFDSTILLKSLAYEIAVSLRETQVYSLSVLGSEQGFDAPYGLSFSPNSKQYIFFQFAGPQGQRPRFNSDAINLNTYLIGRSLEVAEVCVTRAGGSEDCSLTRLDISFERPEFEAIFFAVDDDGGWSENENDDIVNGTIKVRSTAADEVWIVDVSLLGQIDVYRETS